MLAPLRSGVVQMHMRSVTIALLLGSVAIPAAAQDVQSLVAKNLEARGGGAAIDSLKSVRFEGRMIFPGDFELKYAEARARLGAASASRVDATLQGLDAVQAFDGHGGAWKINPFQGRKDPEKMSADEARALADSSLLEGPLLASRRDASHLQDLGRDGFGGTPACKAQV